MPSRSALLPVITVGLALLCGFGALALLGRDPIAAMQAMLRGGLGSWSAIGESAVRASILTLCALAVALPNAGGLFNIGGQGQFLWGALTAAALGQALALPAVITLPICVLGAAAAGGLYAALAGWLKVQRGVHEVISTILLNWIALHLIENYLVIGPLAAHAADASLSLPGTPLIHPQAQLPVLLEGTRLHAGVLIALAAAFVAAYAMRRRVWGLELRAVGASPEAARTAGIPVKRRQLEAMALGGACAGLAGALLVLGTELRYPPHVSTPYGFDGIALSFIGANQPLGALAASAFFGIIRVGGTRLQLLNIHRDFPELIQGLTLLFVAGKMLLSSLLDRVLPARTSHA